ncbi:hypothetical protein [Bailinhaonella thermotolerans]|uniref:Uncharacterized protein n=1 Tax=Bailinhaonella thermotolerans TaxID=1070861 RepID=A0A3A4AQW4_9ACTN|nr:hypothetical protein [Bailinhaonella thermotolerans]RJL30999.1 hypothetical protein D5H75_22225 [Bailinhaonella thermotolerans]
MDPTSRDLHELRLGLYGTAADRERLLGEFRALLDAEAPGRWKLLTAEADDPVDDELTVADLYAELPVQWRAEHPAESPGERAVFELRAGVLATFPEARVLLDALTRAVCPDPEHPGPCPVPWSSSGVTPPLDPADRAYLAHHYASLRTP